MMYYQEKDAKPFLQAGGFDTHPKVSLEKRKPLQDQAQYYNDSRLQGVIPLGDAYAAETTDPSQPFTFEITHPGFGSGSSLLAAESAESLKEWLKLLQDCSRV